MKSIKIEFNEYAVSIIGIAAGLLLLIFPQQAISVIAYGIGAVAMIYGLMKVISYFRNKNISSFFFLGELILGIILLGIGLFSFSNPAGIFAVLPIILGILVMIEGISKVQRAMMLRKYSYQNWGAACIVGICIIALGIVLIVNPFSALVVTMRVLGAIVLMDGICGIWVSLMLKKLS